MTRANVLPGECIAQVKSGSLFPSISCHVLWSTIEGYTPDQALMCNDLPCGKPTIKGKVDSPQAQEYNGLGPDQYATPYGSYVGGEDGAELPDSGWRFDLSQLETWEPIVGYAGTTYVGPRLGLPNVYLRLKERNQKTEPFENLENVLWTNPDYTVYENDWLGNLMPGGWCYTNHNVPEPMKAQVYYEDGHKAGMPDIQIDKDHQNMHENWMPFCNPLRVYNTSGNQIGTFDGIAFIVFFNAAGVKDPINPPDDFTVKAAGVNWPKLNPTRQILNLEVWFYLSGNGIKSPRVATARYWSYTRGLSYLDGGGLLDKNNPFNPYLFFNAGSLTDEIQMQIRFALKTDPIANPMALSHKKSKVVLSGAHFFIGA